jgi:hypothetical protein
LSSGSARKIAMRRLSTSSASLKAWRRLSSGPVAAAGSSTPQWAEIGCPGQSGQTSPAALSHTVSTKSIAGAPGNANSSQLLLRSADVS